MDRMKQFGKWLLAVVLLYLFTAAITHICLHPKEVGGGIYNFIHRPQASQTNQIDK